MVRRMLTLFSVSIMLVFCLIVWGRRSEVKVEMTEEIMTGETVIETEGITVEATQKKEMVIPQYYQQDYADVSYGNYGTVSTHGCGITSLAMALSGLLDEEITPDVLALEYGEYNTDIGSAWALFETACADYGVSCKQIHWPLDEVIKGLQNGKVVISNQVGGIFSGGGHYILLTKMENGKVFVNDPNRYNYVGNLKEGFKNGFAIEQIQYNSTAYWIIG